MLAPRDGAWGGWVWPVAVTDGREPVVTQEFKSWDGGDRNDTTRSANHLGVDIMFPKRNGDPVQAVKHDASRMFIAPKGTLVIAAGPGRVWSAGSGAYGKYVLVDHGAVGGVGVNTFYQHLESFAQPWVRGARVEAGTVLGVMGYSPALDSEQLRHLHFELRFPVAGTSQQTWPVDPAPYLAGWRKVAARRLPLATIAMLALFVAGALLLTRVVVA